MARQSQAAFNQDFQQISEGASLEEVVEKFNSLSSQLENLNKLLSLEGNFSAKIQAVTFAAAGAAGGGDTRRIEHLFGFIPKYRIILRQTGNGVLEDIPSGWNDKIITIKNRGTESVTATIMIVRE